MLFLLRNLLPLPMLARSATQRFVVCPTQQAIYPRYTLVGMSTSVVLVVLWFFLRSRMTDVIYRCYGSSYINKAALLRPF